MLFGRKKPEIVTLTVTETMEEAQKIQDILSQYGIRSVLRERGSDQDMRIIGASIKQDIHGVDVIVNPDEAETAAKILYDVGYFGETEELTDEELEELAMSMEEITGLEDEE